MGKSGLEEVGRLCITKADYIRRRISGIRGFSPLFDRPFFKGLAVRTPSTPSRLLDELLKEKIIGGLDLSRLYPELGNAKLVSVTEKRSREETGYKAGRFERLITILTTPSFCDAMIAIAKEADQEPALIKKAPHTRDIGRLDEVKAARNPDVCFQPHGKDT